MNRCGWSRSEMPKVMVSVVRNVVSLGSVSLRKSQRVLGDVVQDKIVSDGSRLEHVDGLQQVMQAALLVERAGTQRNDRGIQSPFSELDRKELGRVRVEGVVRRDYLEKLAQYSFAHLYFG